MSTPAKSALDVYRNGRDDLERVIDDMAAKDAAFTEHKSMSAEEIEQRALEIEGLISLAESKGGDLKPLFDNLDAFRKDWYSDAQKNVDRFIGEQRNTLARVREHLAAKKDKT